MHRYSVSPLSLRLHPSALAVRLALTGLFLAGMVDSAAIAQEVAPIEAKRQEKFLDAVEVTASADASAEGLTKNFAGGQVARGGRIGLLGNEDIMDTPFSTTAYTSELIRDQQAKSVADVLLSDPTVRATQGFANAQEMYMIRGFPVPSDDMTYNGLYGMLPRQYVAAEFIERIEVLRGANAFLNGGTGAASGFGVGGSVNVLPKRAGNNPLNQVTAGIDNGGHGLLAADLSRRFGENQETGIRINAAKRDGTGVIAREDRELSLLSIGADYRGRGFRLSADAGYQTHRINAPRPSVFPGDGIPDAPNARTNFAQDWTYSQERSTFATARAEFDLSDSTLAWAALGLRHGDENNRFAVTSSDAEGVTSSYRFDNLRKDDVRSAEIGLRTKFSTGNVHHTAVVSAAHYQLESRNAFAFSDSFDGNLYQPTQVAMPATAAIGEPTLTEKVNNTSIALADTLAFAEDRVRLTVGARHQRLDNTSFGVRYDEARVTPMAGLVFKLQTDVSLYANYIEGLTKGDSAPSTATNFGTTLAPYVSKQKEIGIKYDGKGIGGGVALFSVARPFGIVNDNSHFEAGGEQRNQGIELSLFGAPTRGVRLLGGITLLHAEITKSEDDTLTGKRPVGVPRQQINLGADLDVPQIAGLAVNARLIHTGGQYANGTNTMSIPAWTRLDLGARYITEINKQMVTLRARLDNATGRDYWASTGGYPGYGYMVLGAPRTFTISATVDF